MTERRSELFYLLFGLGIAAVWFSFNRNIDFGPYQPGSDAVTYAEISRTFKNFGEAFTYAGDRTFGFPFVLYLIQRLSNLFGIVSLETLFGIQTATLLIFHLTVSIFFYRAIRNYSEKYSLRLHPASLALILIHPGLVSHTAVLLTDTFAADLVMIIIIFLTGAKSSTIRGLILRGSAVGLVLSFAIATRPFLMVTALALIIGGLLLAVIFRSLKHAFVFFLPLLCVMAIVLLPSVLQCRGTYGKFCQQNPSFAGQALADSMKIGLLYTRFYGSTRSTSPILTEEWTMVEHWRSTCDIEKITGPLQWAACVSTQPIFFPVFLGKKLIALFDSFFLQPYAQDVTPAWARNFGRVFGTASFVGFFCTIGIFFGFLWHKRYWESLAIAIPILTILFQLPMHIEPRYSFSAIPICLVSVIWMIQWSRRQGPRALITFALATSVLAGTFYMQVHTWDLDDLILQQREGWDRPGPGVGSETLKEKEEMLAKAEAAVAIEPSAENRISLGLALAAFGRHFDATQQYEQASTTVRPGSEAVIALTTSGHLCMENNILRRWDEAIRHCEKALSFQPNFSLAENGLRYAKQAKRVEKITQTAGSSQINYGMEHYNRGTWRLAIEAWREVPSTSPHFATALSNIASAYIMLKDFQNARIAIDEAIRLEPHNDLFLNNLSWLEQESKKADR